MNANPEELRIERLTGMALRLIEALESDVAALKAGDPAALRTPTPEIQRLSAQYSREAAGLDIGAARLASPDARRKLFETTKRFREVLEAQTRLLKRLRGASEGLVRAVVEELERQRASLRPYGASQQCQPRPSEAMLYNSVV